MVTYPHGGKIDYTYQLVRFEYNNIFDTTAIRTKVTSGPGITGGTWTYQFSPSTGLGVNDSTTVYTPDGITTYAHQGYVTGGSLVWPIGLLWQKINYDTAGNPLEAITNHWGSRILSEENYWHGRTLVENDTQAPILTSTSHWLRGSVLATDYFDHDKYGNPGRIEEECDLVGCDKRITHKTYLNDPLQWIIGFPVDDTIDGIGTVSRTYYANGQLKETNEYGVITSFEYTPQGDLSKETNARGFSHTYSDYYRGVARQESRQVSATKNIQTSRTVNNTGTIGTVTDGRGITTSFSYDQLNRLTSIDFPINNDVVINNALRLKTLTRGNYQERTELNGFGRPVRSERKDLAAGESIVTDTSYDALGRSVFHSYPNSTLGVSTKYDALGKPVKITKGDNSFVTIEYGSFLDQSDSIFLGNVKTTDESMNVVYTLEKYYGSYDNSVGVVNLITDETYTYTKRGILGEVTEVIQGKLGDGVINNAIVRKYTYDSHHFLETITNPETGVTQFGRDEVGNKISSQVGASGITQYAYDGLNRLTIIDYPGGTDDVTYQYDDNSNVEQSSKGGITWQYGYDNNENLISEILSVAGVDSRSFAISYGYDGLDAVSQVIYPNNLIVDYQPDAFGRATKAGAYVSSASYYPNGVLDQVTYTNGVVTKNTLNTIQLLASIQAIQPALGDVVDLQFSYSPTGNVEDVFDGIDATNNLTLDYDANDRLVSASGRWGTGDITYTAHGNIQAKRIGGSDLSYGYSASRRLSQVADIINPDWRRYTNKYNDYAT